MQRTKNMLASLAKVLSCAVVAFAITAQVQAADASRRRTMLSFAARAYELEHGKPPASAADLVPAYLKTIPQDPNTGTNMVYSP